MPERPDFTEYTPDTATIRTFYTSDTDGNPLPGRAAQFNRWLETIRSEAKAEGMREAIESVRWVYNIQCPVKPSDRYIHRAARIAHKWWEQVLGGRLDELERRANQYKEAK